MWRIKSILIAAGITTLVSIGLQAQDAFFAQWNLHLAQVVPTYQGSQALVPVIPLGGALTTPLHGAHWKLRYHVQYAHRRYNTACFGCRYDQEGRSEFDQVELGGTALLDLGELFTTKKLQFLFGAGVVSQYVFDRYEYGMDHAGTEYGSVVSEQIGVFVSVPAVLSTQLTPRFRLEMTMEGRLGMQRVGRTSKGVAQSAQGRISTHTDQQFERFVTQWVPLRLSAAYVIDPERRGWKDKKKADDKGQEGE